MVQSVSGDRLLYVGTYQENGAESVFLLKLNEETGELAKVSANAETENPSFLIVNAKRDRLYAVIEKVDAEGKGGEVAAFAIDGTTGSLRLLNIRSTQGGAPCHLTLTEEGQALIVANYMTGNVVVYPLEADGRIGELSDEHQHEGCSVTERQEGPHAHCVVLKDGHIYATDLGTDEIVRYRLDRKQSGGPGLEPAGSVSVKAGAGPRHLTFHPSEPFAYLINELDSTITTFRYDAASGALNEVQTVSALPADYAGTNLCADIHVHPSGHTLYGSNRGHNSIAAFSIDRSSGRLSLLQHVSTQGETPRNFGLTPDGGILVAANQDSDSIFTYKVHSEKGTLEPTGHSMTVPRPVCIRFR